MNRKMRNRLLSKFGRLWAVACLLAWPATAAPIEFRTLSVDDGLSQSTVLAMAQDPLGRIWMGTQDGLNRYDGHTLTLKHI